MGETTDDTGATRRAGTSRRAMLAGAAGVGVTAALAACGSDSADTDPYAGRAAPTTGAAQPPAQTAAPTRSAPGGATGGPTAGGAVLARKADIPVGGGKIFEAQKVVVTQPTAGTFKAFDVTCTHQGCPVSAVRNGTINCVCHNSSFSVADGSVKSGPARAPLAGKNITVAGDSISLA
jgi:Rieske Fe-S protein